MSPSAGETRTADPYVRAIVAEERRQVAKRADYRAAADRDGQMRAQREHHVRTASLARQRRLGPEATVRSGRRGVVPAWYEEGLDEEDDAQPRDDEQDATDDEDDAGAAFWQEARHRQRSHRSQAPSDTRRRRQQLSWAGTPPPATGEPSIGYTLSTRRPLAERMEARTADRTNAYFNSPHAAQQEQATASPWEPPPPPPPIPSKQPPPLPPQPPPSYHWQPPPPDALPHPNFLTTTPSLPYAPPPPMAPHMTTYYPHQEHAERHPVPRPHDAGQAPNQQHSAASSHHQTVSPQLWHQLAAAERKVAEAMGTLVSLRRQARSAPSASPVRV